MKIAVFMGGSSAEREISLKSGKAVAAGLAEKKHEVILYDVEWEGKNTLFTAVEEITKNGTEIVFSALHGGLGENGGVQAVLEAAGIVYTGSGITASAVAMNKDISKSLFVHHGIPTAPWVTFSADNIDPAFIESHVGYPCVVKTVDQGSSIGLALVNGPGDIPAAVEKAAAYGDILLAEQFVPGKELTVPILGDTALPVIEIHPAHPFFDYECKYTHGMTEYFVPAPIPDTLTHEICSLALKVFRVLGLRDIARIDFRLDKEGYPLCFEANTLPGMTSTSLVPKSAAQAGIDFPELVDTIARLAYQRTRIA